MKRIIASTIAGLLLATAGAGVANATPPVDEPKKVLVCKYVGTPGVDERLQTGQNPISVSVNAIPNYTGPGSEFADKQGRSVVVADGAGCPAPILPPPPPPPVPVVDYIIAVWEFRVATPAPGDQAPYPQNLVRSYITPTASIAGVTHSVPCGFGYQIDVYANDARTVAVLDRGVLNGWRTDGESWPGGAYKPEYSYVNLGVECTPQPPAEFRFEDRLVTDCEAGFVATWRTTFMADYVPGGNNNWVLGEFVQVGVEEQVTWRDATAEPCPPIVVPPVDPPVDPPVEEPEVPVTPLPEVVDPPVVVDPKPVAAPVAPAPATEPLAALPETGPVEDALLSVLAVGLMLLVAGFSVWLGGKTKHHRYDKQSK